MKRLANVNLYAVMFCLCILMGSSSIIFASPKEVHVGIYDNKPMMFMSETRPQGIYIDILENIAKKENWKLDYRYGSWHETYHLLISGKIDILPVVAFKESRLNQIDYCKETLVSNWGQIYTRKNFPIESIDALSEKKIATLSDDTHSEHFKALLNQMGIPFQNVLLENYRDIFHALESGKCDAGVVNYIAAKTYSEKLNIQSTPIVFNPIQMRYAVPKGDPAGLLESVDKHIIAFKTDKNSIYYSSMAKFLGMHSFTEFQFPAWMKWGTAFACGLVALLFAGTVFLRFQVRVKTKELSKELKNRIKAEEEIKKSEERYRKLVEQSPCISYHYSQKDGATYWSNSIKNVLGFSLEEITRNPFLWTNSIHPDDIGYVKDAISKVPLGRNYDLEYRIKDSDGKWHWFHDRLIGRIIKDETVIIEGLAIDITKRKEVENELQRNEERFRGIVESMSDWIWETDSIGRYTYCSENVVTILGYSSKEVIGKTPFDFMVPHEAERIKELFFKVLEVKGLIKDLENWNTTKDGKQVCLLTNGVPIIGEKDELIGYRGVDSDITIRKQTMEKLIKSEEKFRSAFFTSPDAINLNRIEDGMYLEINEGFTKIMGYTREDITGKSSLELNIWNDPRDRERLVSGLKKYGVVENLEAEFRGKDGQIRTGLMSARIITIKNETIILSITRDITEIKQNERDTQTLVETTVGKTGQELFDGVVTKLCDWLRCECAIISEITQDGTATVLSMVLDGKFITEFSYPLKGSPCDETARKGLCVYPENVRKSFPNSLDLIQIGAEGYIGTALRGKDDVMIGILCCISREKLEIKKNTPIIMNIIGSRVSSEIVRIQAEREKAKLETKIQQSQKMEAIGTLAGGIAHDFNNILFPILGHTEMLLEDTPEDSPIRNSLNEIYAGSLRARDLAHQILSFSRQEKTGQKLMKVQPIIKEALKLIRSTIPATISINQNLESNCGAVKTDPTQIHQIVMNLATNAYHAMEETGGELKVTLKETELSSDDLINPDMAPGLYACLSVSDTGMGIKKDVVNRIFEPFFTTKEKGKGTGMGLSVVHGIVKSMNGGIQVFSKPGQGTEFHVYLPVFKTDFEKQVAQTKELVVGGSERILLVDDESSIIEMEKQVLDRLGYKVTSRISSMEALEVFRADPGQYDLVITDMSMPKLSGDKLAIELIKIRPDIPVLLCTGFSENMTDEKVKSLGIKGLLMKPIVIKDLAKKIREVFDDGKKVE